MINAVFAGCGRISDLHALGYANNKEARIYGLYDPDRERAERKAALWRVDKIYKSYEEALADPAVNLVEILTPITCTAQCLLQQPGPVKISHCKNRWP